MNRLALEAVSILGLALLGASCIIAAGGQSAASRPVPIAQTQPTRTPEAPQVAPIVTLPTITGGPGVSSSPPFVLDGGDYAVTWATEQPSDRVTFIDLKSADGDSVLDSHVILNASAGTSGSSGETNLYRVKTGRYYLAVRAPSNWTVTVNPLPSAAIPPTAAPSPQAASVIEPTPSPMVAAKPTIPAPTAVPKPAQPVAAKPASARVAPQGSSCPLSNPVKGNKSSSGELIYHTRGGQFYDRTQPEACFATEADARAAGYRASQR